MRAIATLVSNGQPSTCQISYFDFGSPVVGARRRARRVHPDRQVVRVRHALEHREELRLVERPPVDAGADLDAARAERSDRAVHLLERRGHVVHRQRGDEGRKFLRPFAAHLRHAVVGDARELGRSSGPPSSSGGGSDSVSTCCTSGNFSSSIATRASMSHSMRRLVMRLTMPGVLRVLLHHLEVARRHDVVEDVDLHL